MQYHADSLRRISDAIPSGHPDDLTRAEKRLGVRFAPSVREWYGEIDGNDLLSTYSNMDRALTPDEFELVRIGGKSLVIVMVENQAVCRWGFEVDEADDPAVHVQLKPWSGPLFRFARRFSEFTYVQIFDFAPFRRKDAFFSRSRKPLTDEDLEWLSGNLAAEPWTLGWPSDVTYRFASPLGQIIIWQSERESYWNLYGATEDSLLQLKRLVAPLLDGNS
jgi:hypothetical protein